VSDFGFFYELPGHGVPGDSPAGFDQVQAAALEELRATRAPFLLLLQNEQGVKMIGSAGGAAGIPLDADVDHEAASRVVGRVWLERCMLVLSAAIAREA